MTFQIILTLFVFIASYLIISFDLINKASIVILGASILLLFGVLTPEEAFEKINLSVIFLLTSLMILANVTKDSGLFQYVAIKLAKLARGDALGILLLLSVITGATSAFLDNVTTVVMLCPLAILIAAELHISPVPFIITMAIASNIGGTATLIGDPPNIMIGYSAGLSFNDFLFNEGLLILLIGLVSVGITVLIFRKKLKTDDALKARIMSMDETGVITNRALCCLSILVWIYLISGFLLQGVTHTSPTVVAMSGAAILLVITRSNPEKYFAEVEWVTIFFFIGLFILVGALEKMAIIDFIGHKLVEVSSGNVKTTSLTILWGSGILSGFIDNIPFVAVMIPLIHSMNLHIGATDANILWWSLSTGACLGGNFTLIGASANVVASEIANKKGYTIKFWDFTKYGVLYTLVALGISTVYFLIRYF